MQTFVVLRRNGWKTAEQLQQAAERSKAVGGEMVDDVRWIRTYAFEEPGGSLGTACIYQATDAEALRRHAKLAELPADEIVPVMDTLILRPDPEAA